MENIAGFLMLALGFLVIFGGGYIAHREKTKSAPEPVREKFVLKGALVIAGASWLTGICFVINSSGPIHVSREALLETLGWGLAQGAYFCLAGFVLFFGFSGAFERLLDRANGGQNE